MVSRWVTSLDLETETAQSSDWYPGRQQRTVQTCGSLTPMWETQTEYWATGSNHQSNIQVQKDFPQWLSHVAKAIPLCIICLLLSNLPDKGWDQGFLDASRELPCPFHCSRRSCVLGSLHSLRSTPNTARLFSQLTWRRVYLFVCLLA